MFSGLRSRCATPREWMYSNASKRTRHASLASFSLKHVFHTVEKEVEKKENSKEAVRQSPGDMGEDQARWSQIGCSPFEGGVRRGRYFLYATFSLQRQRGFYQRQKLLCER